MQTTYDEEMGIPPSVMTAEFFNPQGKRYNFEQIVIDAGSHIEIVNESGDKMIFRFWQGRQPETNYPVDPETSIQFEKDLGKIVIPEPTESEDEKLINDWFNRERNK